MFKNATLVAEINVPGRPLTLNQERKLNRFARAAKVKEWREHAFLVAKSVLGKSKFDSIAIVAQPILTKKIKQDTGGCFPSVKAVIDGLVDAGVIPHDGPEVVRALAFRAPVLGAAEDGLNVEVWVPDGS